MWPEYGPELTLVCVFVAWALLEWAGVSCVLAWLDARARRRPYTRLVTDALTLPRPLDGHAHTFTDVNELTPDPGDRCLHCGYSQAQLDALARFHAAHCIDRDREV